MKMSISLPQRYWITVALSVVVGAFVAGLSVAFILLIQASEQLLHWNVSHDSLARGFTQWHWWVFISLPLGGLIVGLLSYYVMPGRKNIGFAGVVEAAHLRGGMIRFREGIGIGLISAVSIGAGASVGRYGPAAHLGASAGSWLAQIFNLNKENRVILLGCGVAAAVAASFNTPFAAVIFAHELVIRNYNMRAFAPVAIASTIGVILGRYFNAHSMFDTLTFAPVTSITDYGVAVLIGVACAYIGIAFLKLLVKANAFGAQLAIHPIAKPILGGVLLACVAAVLPHTLGLGGLVVNQTILMEHALWFLCILLVAKACTIAISFALGFNGGLFGPALFLGTLGAAIVITLLQLAGVQIDAQSTLVLIGGGSLISVIFGVPIATTIIIFELAGSHSVASAMLIGVVVTRLLVNKSFGKSYIDYLIGGKGIDIATSREDELMQEHQIKKYMQTSPVTIAPEATLAEVKDALARCGASQELFVVDVQQKLVGIISAHNLLQASSTSAMADVMQQPTLLLHTDTSLQDAMQKITNFTGLAVPVLDQEDRLAGMISESALINAYQEISRQIQHEQHA